MRCSELLSLKEEEELEEVPQVRRWVGMSSGQGCGAGWEVAGQTDPQLPLRNVPSQLQCFEQCFEVLCPRRLLGLHY